MSGRRREQGIVLVLVMIFLLLLVSSISTFGRRAVLDATIVANRNATAQAEALGRGGVQLGIALLLEDRLREQESQLPVDTGFDVWARARELELDLADDAELVLDIRDAGARLNLNALFDEGALLDGAAEVLLVELLDKAIAEAELRPEDAAYDTRELARNLIDYVDADDTGMRGEVEDVYYQDQDPPYRAANRPLLSVSELALVQGFDQPLVEALRPYVTVFPYVDGGGINPNTAPPWVLGTLYHGVAGDYRFATSQTAEDVVRARESGQVLCPEETQSPVCSPIDALVVGETFPPVGVSSDVFEIRAEARVGEVRRTVEAVVDRSDPRSPLVLSWRVR